MNYYTDLFTVETFEAYLRSDRSISGFRESQLGMAKRLEPGDKLIAYIKGLSRWAGILEVIDGPSIDACRFSIRPMILSSSDFVFVRWLVCRWSNRFRFVSHSYSTTCRLRKAGKTHIGWARYFEVCNISPTPMASCWNGYSLNRRVHQAPTRLTPICSRPCVHSRSSERTESLVYWCPRMSPKHRWRTQGEPASRFRSKPSWPSSVKRWDFEYGFQKMTEDWFVRTGTRRMGAWLTLCR